MCNLGGLVCPDLSWGLQNNYFLSSTQVYFERRPENIRDPGFLGVNWAHVRSYNIIRYVLSNTWDLKPVVQTSSLFADGFRTNYLESFRLRKLSSQVFWGQWNEERFH